MGMCVTVYSFQYIKICALALQYCMVYAHKECENMSDFREIKARPDTWLEIKLSFTQTAAFRSKILLARSNDNLICVYIKM
jgi:hypothetical protein